MNWLKKYHWELLFAICLLFFYFLVLGNNLVYVDNYLYIDGIVEQYPERFSLPLFYFVGLVGYWLMGDISFYILPLGFFFTSYYLMVRLFKKFHYNTSLIILSFAIAPLFSESVWFFMRDSLFFMLATFFAYYFFKSVKSHAFFWKQLAVTSILMVLTRDFSIVFIFMFICLWIQKYENKMGAVSLGGLINPDWLTNWFNNWIAGTRQLFNLKRITFMSLFPNPLWFISIYSLIRKPSWMHAILIMVSVLTSLSIANMGFDNSTLFRYTFSTFPLHLFFIANAEKEEKHRWTYMVLYAPIVIPAILFWKLGHF